MIMENPSGNPFTSSAEVLKNLILTTPEQLQMKANQTFPFHPLFLRLKYRPLIQGNCFWELPKGYFQAGTWGKHGIQSRKTALAMPESRTSKFHPVTALCLPLHPQAFTS